MRKQTIAAVLFVLALACAGCSNKAAEPTTTATATAAETSAAETTEETETEREEASMTGEVTAVNGDIVTVLSDDDQAEYQLDLSEAEVIRSFDLMAGDRVYVDYYEGEESPLSAFFMEVEESILAQEMDPVVEGTVTDAAMNTITITTEEGNEYTFLKNNAYVVAKNGLAADSLAQVTYVGELDDEPLAVKIVMEDSFGTDEAAINCFIGTVSGLDEAGNIILESEQGDYYTFVSDSLDFSDYKQGDTVQIQYEGKITDFMVNATDISAK